MSRTIALLSTAGFLCLGIATTAQAQVSTTYAYDPLGRLVSVTETARGKSTYAYDAAGNRTANAHALSAPLMAKAISMTPPEASAALAEERAFDVARTPASTQGVDSTARGLKLAPAAPSKP